VTTRGRKTLPEEQERAAAEARERAEGEQPVEAGEQPSDTLSQGPSPLEELEARLAAAEAQRDEYLADLKRLAAEYDNYRKRAAREQERLVAHAHERLVRELLPVLDDFERALEAAERHEEATLVEGVRLVERSLRQVLEREGLAEIEADGAFDPHVHEALLAERREGAEPGSVAEVVQRGYRLGGKVIRPARVIVAE